MQPMQQLAAFALLALTPLSLAPPTGRAPADVNLQKQNQNAHLDTLHGYSLLLALLRTTRT